MRVGIDAQERREIPDAADPVPRTVVVTQLSTSLYCPRCGAVCVPPAPVEPLYDLALVPSLIPCTKAALLSFLRRHPFEERRYRRDRSHRKHRLLSVSEINAIRSRMVRP